MKPDFVLGHTCEGLREWQAADRTCHLAIDEEGLIGSCDALVEVPIKFCPFCGTKL